MSEEGLDREHMRAIMEARMGILFMMMERYVRQGCTDAARKLRSQISGMLFLAEGIGLVTEAEKTAYEEDSFRRCYSVYRHPCEFGRPKP